MFRTRSLRPSVLPSPIGNGERGIFEERFENGVKTLVKTGSEDLKEFIEASKDETMIDSIIRRYNRGDVSVLSKVQGFYGDVTNMPSNIIEAKNHLIKLENQFDSLPSEIKRKFDNSFDVYVNKVSTMTIEQFTTHFGLDKKLDESESLVSIEPTNITEPVKEVVN